MSNKWKGFGVAGLVIAFVAMQFVNVKAPNSLTPSARKPASSDTTFKGSQNVSDANTWILNIQSKEDLKKVVQQILQKDAQVNPVVGGRRLIKDEGLRFYAIAASVVPYFEGSVYRLRYIVEKNKMLYVPSIAALRAMKYSSSYAPKFYDAGFEYLTKPNLGQNILGYTGPFKDISELQTFATEKLSIVITNALVDLESLIKNGDANRVVFVSDLSLVLGKNEADRVRKEFSDKKFAGHEVSLDKIVLAGHLKKLVAQGYEALGVSYYVGSFNLDGANEFASKFLTQSYMSSKGRWVTNLLGDISDANNIPSPKERADMFKEVRKSFPNFLKINDKAVVNLNKSWRSFQASANIDADYHAFLFDIAGRLASPDSYIVNADLIKDYEHEAMEMFNKRKEIFSKQAPIRIKTATHRSFDVNISVFFDPNKVADLGYFMPQQFAPGPEVFGRGHDKYEWNYNYGKPLAWNSPNFSGLFSSDTKQSDVGQRIADIALYPALNHLSALMALFI